MRIPFKPCPVAVTDSATSRLEGAHCVPLRQMQTGPEAQAVVQVTLSQCACAGTQSWRVMSHRAQAATVHIVHVHTLV